MSWLTDSINGVFDDPATRLGLSNPLEIMSHSIVSAEQAEELARSYYAINYTGVQV